MNHLTVSTNQRASPEPWITEHIPEYARKGCLRNNFNSLTAAVRSKLRPLAMENAPIEKKKVVSKGPIWKKSWESLEKGNLIPYLIMVDSTNMWVTNFLAFFKNWPIFSWNPTRGPGKFRFRIFLDGNRAIAQSSRIFWKFRVSKFCVIPSDFHKFHNLGLKKACYSSIEGYL